LGQRAHHHSEEQQLPAVGQLLGPGADPHLGRGGDEARAARYLRAGLAAAPSLAKELATLQNLSGGRLILGGGVGWLEGEFDALGVPFSERGRRMDEGIAMMRAVWSQDPVTFEPTWILAKIEAMRSHPQPIVPIPIWIGGSSDAAIRRALRMDGWHGSRVSVEQAAATVKRLRANRPDEMFTISLRVTCSAHTVGDMRNTLREYRDAGIQHVMAAPEARDIDTYLATAEAFRNAGEGL
jgi:alkanesulfonate monooxygenase SsuD/methylene tetrahydromethanopterin reductase-like flavin-dependent oxidoreductase (luciferase family)